MYTLLIRHEWQLPLITVSGLAKLEGEMIDCDYDEISKDICTKYQLTGIVVHSGQASGGHYYSYILHRYMLTHFKCHAWNFFSAVW